MPGPLPPTGLLQPLPGLRVPDRGAALLPAWLQGDHEAVLGASGPAALPEYFTRCLPPEACSLQTALSSLRDDDLSASSFEVIPSIGHVDPGLE